ncbi:hypothetical protein TrVGV298_005197 [Trichoderma virens]|nr:hypothetical protein TrVGV298_005197 [Trichoderma virens]
MQFTTLLVAAFAAIAQAVDVQVVSVGQNPMAGMAGQPALKYYPDNIKAAPGSMVQFQFWAGNHTVTQSDFDHPCTPISQVNSSVAGIWSSFMPVAAGAAKKEIPVFTVMINDTKPIWIFCSQGKHCSNGMSMVINENTSANATRSLTNYRTAASTAQAPAPALALDQAAMLALPPASAPTDTGAAPTDVVAPPPSVTTGGSSPVGTGVLPGGATDTGIPKSGASSVGVSTSLLLALGAAFALL